MQRECSESRLFFSRETDVSSFFSPGLMAAVHQLIEGYFGDVYSPIAATSIATTCSSLRAEQKSWEEEVNVNIRLLDHQMVCSDSLLHNAKEQQTLQAKQGQGVLQSLKARCKEFKKQLEETRASKNSVREEMASLADQREVIESTLLYLQVVERVRYLSKEAKIAVKAAILSTPDAVASEEDLRSALSPFFGLTHLRDQIYPLHCHNLIEFANSQIKELVDPLEHMAKGIFTAKLEGKLIVATALTGKLYRGQILCFSTSRAKERCLKSARVSKTSMNSN